mmetsp:Transcript_560/g.1251  ORF Transcript_560/g.1251 Transcript_560/m.1251 type:complete len:90 (+) Transcript_560:1671-1940(+)
MRGSRAAGWASCSGASGEKGSPAVRTEFGGGRQQGEDREVGFGRRALAASGISSAQPAGRGREGIRISSALVFRWGVEAAGAATTRGLL